ncbi:MAG: hypothetical protein ACON4O_09550 [Lentimonas sp.]
MKTSKPFLVVSVLVASLSSSVSGQLVSFTEDFEAMTAGQEGIFPNDFSAAGWFVGGNVFESDGTYVYGYFGEYPAPNGGSAFSGIASGEGGENQGSNQLNIYNDYNNESHADGSDRRVEALVYKDIGTISLGDVGETISFSFDAKQGNISGDSTANVFIKVLKISDSTYETLGYDEFDTTALGTLWTGGSVELQIAADWVGELVQIGFSSTADNYGDTGVYYDNLGFVGTSGGSGGGTDEVFAVDSILVDVDESTATLTFPSVEGETFDIQFTDDLGDLSNSASWSNLATAYPADAGVSETTYNVSPITTTKGFYRVIRNQ